MDAILAHILDQHQTTGILGAVLCVCGVCLFLGLFNRGIVLALRLLRTLFEIKDANLPNLEGYRVSFSVLALLTAALAIMVVLMNYLRATANPRWTFCVQSADSRIAVSAMRAMRKTGDRCCIIYGLYIYI